MDNPRVRGSGPRASSRESAACARDDQAGVQELRHDVGHAVVGADVVDGEQIWMVERGGGARLLLESPHAIGIADNVRQQDFESDLAAQPRVVGAIDLAHPARAERRLDLVGTDSCA